MGCRLNVTTHYLFIRTDYGVANLGRDEIKYRDSEMDFLIIDKFQKFRINVFCDLYYVGIA